MKTSCCPTCSCLSRRLAIRCASVRVPSAKAIDELNPTFRCLCSQVAKTHHGLLLQDFANTILHGQTQGVTAADSLGESLTAMAIYRANESGEWEDVFVEAAAYAEPASARL